MLMHKYVKQIIRRCQLVSGGFFRDKVMKIYSHNLYIQCHEIETITTYIIET